MTFKEKIDNLLRISGKKFNSVYDLEQKSGVGMGTLRKAYEANREPSKRTIWKFLENLGINSQWWETGEGEIYEEKGTYVELPTKKDPGEEVRILIKNLDRMGEMNEFLLRELKSYQDKFGRI